jgi:hypothetical protein
LAQNVVAVALPLASVVTISVSLPFANQPVASDVGAVNVTTTPLTGFESLSSTVATNGSANAKRMTALCPDPLVAVIVVGTRAVLVRLKLAGADNPVTKAVTV